jgi:hypothetical protein
MQSTKRFAPSTPFSLDGQSRAKRPKQGECCKLWPSLTRFKLLFTDWRGYLIAGFSLVWVANVYMSLFARIRLDVKHERVEISAQEKAVGNNVSADSEKSA